MFQTGVADNPNLFNIRNISRSIYRGLNKQRKMLRGCYYSMISRGERGHPCYVQVQFLIDMSQHERSVVKTKRVMNEAGRRLAIL